MAEPLARGAVVYVRQSTPDQVLHIQESRRRQYALADRARQLGWTDVTIIDSDLGRSGAGTELRPGFEKLLLAVCEGRVGAVFSIEASRLSRNGRDWHTLLDSTRADRRQIESDNRNCEVAVTRRADRRCVGWLCRRGDRRLPACWRADDVRWGGGGSDCERVGRRAVCERRGRAGPRGRPSG